MWKRFNTGRKWIFNCSEYDVCWRYKNVTLCHTCSQTHMYMYIISTKSKLLILGPSKLKKWNRNLTIWRKYAKKSIREEALEISHLLGEVSVPLQEIFPSHLVSVKVKEKTSKKFARFFNIMMYLNRNKIKPHSGCYMVDRIYVVSVSNKCYKIQLTYFAVVVHIIYDCVWLYHYTNIF